MGRIAGEVLSRYGGEVREVVKLLRGKRLARHTDGDKIVGVSGKRHGLPDIARLGHISGVGVPVGVGPGGDLEQGVALVNHSSARKIEDEVWGEVI